LIERPASDLTKAVRIEFVERQADDPAARNESGAAEVEQPGQEFATCEVAGGAHEYDHLRISRTDP